MKPSISKPNWNPFSSKKQVSQATDNANPPKKQIQVLHVGSKQVSQVELFNKIQNVIFVFVRFRCEETQSKATVSKALENRPLSDRFRPEFPTKF